MDEEITRALGDWADGDRTALDRLAPAVYPHLRSLAEGLLRRERAGHTLQPTALVNELFVKLMGQRGPRYEDRRHFYNACAKLMRLALIDHARGVQREKRGSGQAAVPLHEEMAWLDAAGPEMIDLDRLLDELAERDPEQVAMFEARYLLGCTAEETAELFGTSKATVDRKVRVARAWLFQRLKGGTDS
ncbi:MAG: ECF-type sigma factor [Bryobacteraceae bacterium]|nr:ECF-type sigma factor [Bryobacteraceae bacterium]